MARITPIIAVALTASSSLLLTACSSEEPAETSQTAGQQRAPDHTYTNIRGIITQLPDPQSPGSSLSIRHETIPHFKDHTDTEIGMNTMTMPFPPAADLDISSLNVGDKVSFSFDVWWEGSRPEWALTEFTILPPDTQLDFSPLPEPPAPDQPEPDSPADAG